MVKIKSPQRLIVIIFAIILFSNFTLAIDDLFSIQGNVQQAGVNLASGNLTVTIYDAFSGGNMIYNTSGTYNNTIVNGKYDVVLGNSSVNLSLEYGKVYYMEIYINNEKITFQDGATRQIFQSSVGNISFEDIDFSSKMVLNNQSSSFDAGQNLTTSGNGWFKGLFNWVVNSSWGSYLYFNGSDLSLSDYANATWTSTYNATYAPFAYNQTIGTYNLYNSGWVSTFNSTYNASLIFNYNQTIASGWNKTGNNLFPGDLNDKVGIGTSLPGTKLQVGNGSTGYWGGLSYPATPDITITSTYEGNETSIGFSNYEGTNNHRLKLFMDDASGNYGFYTTSSSGGKNFVIGTGTTEYFRVNSLGEVGIGTTTPTQKLDVRGDINISGELYVNNITAVSPWLYNQTIGTYNLYNSGWVSTFNSSYNASLIFNYNQTYIGGTYNATYNASEIWSYNETTISNAYTNAMILANNSIFISTYNETYDAFNTKFVNKSGDYMTGQLVITSGGLNITGGTTDFYGGWLNNGVSVVGGNVFAQSLYVYNITSLGVNNLDVNGSIVPNINFNNTFDIGNDTARYRSGYFGTELYIKNNAVSPWLYNETVGTYNLYNAGWVSTYNETYVGSINNGSYLSTFNESYNTSLVWTYNQTQWNRTSTALYLGVPTLNVGVGISNPSATLQVNSSSISGAFSVHNTTGTSILFVNGSNNRIGIGTTSPIEKLDIQGNTNVSGNLNASNINVINYFKMGNNSFSVINANSSYVLINTSIDSPSLRDTTSEGVILALTFNNDSIHPTYHNMTLDSSGLGNHGNVITVPYNISGGFNGGGSYEFNGTGGSINGNVSFSTVSLTLWARDRTGSSGIRRLFQVDTDELTAYLDPTNDDLQVTYNAGTLCDTNYVPPKDTWKFYALVFNGSTLLTYVDGVKVGGDTCVKTASTFIGNYFVGSTRNHANEWNGSIDEVRIYNRQITYNEIQNLFYRRTEYYPSYVSQRNLFVNSAGKIGIGTIYPTHKLDVRGDINVSGELYVKNITAVSLWLYNQTTDASNLYGAGWNSTYNETYAPFAYNQTSWNRTSTGLYLGAPNLFVGIGTTTPTANLEVGGDMNAFSAGTGMAILGTKMFRFVYSNGDVNYGSYINYNYSAGSLMTLGTRDAGVDTMALTIKGGNVGIGTTAPKTMLEISNNTGGSYVTDFIKLTNTGGFAGGAPAIVWNNSVDGLNTAKIYSDPGASYTASKLYIQVADSSKVLQTRMTIDVNGIINTTSGTTAISSDGDVILTGIGDNLIIAAGGANIGIPSTTTPSNGKLNVKYTIATGGAVNTAYNSFGSGTASVNMNSNQDVLIAGDLEVDGGAYINRATGGSAGNYWSQGDIAENLHTKNSRNNSICGSNATCYKESTTDNLDYEDLVCIDTTLTKTIKKCDEANSRLAVGFISKTYLLNVGSDNGYPIALAGLVPAKLTNENGNIVPGDLLVSSSKPGYAMKSENPIDGTVVGKAFDFCDKEECQDVAVFVALS